MKIDLNYEQLFALANPTRLKIIRYTQKERSTQDIRKFLKDISGNGTTTRHHILILVNAGLLEMTRLEEVRGAHLKFYTAHVEIKK